MGGGSGEPPPQSTYGSGIMPLKIPIELVKLQIIILLVQTPKLQKLEKLETKMISAMLFAVMTLSFGCCWGESSDAQRCCES